MLVNTADYQHFCSEMTKKIRFSLVFTIKMIIFVSTLMT